jgi:hypothetical protein
VQGLTDRSRRPHHYAHKLPFQVENYTLNVKRELDETGAPGETRTPDPLVRSQMLYPAELRARETIIPINRARFCLIPQISRFEP